MIELHVYDNDGNITKTVTGEVVDLKFGQIRDFMALLNADQIESTWELVEAIHRAWDKLVLLLSEAFPEVTYEEWDNVPISELIRALWAVIRESFNALTTVPKDPQ